MACKVKNPTFYIPMIIVQLRIEHVEIRKVLIEMLRYLFVASFDKPILFMTCPPLTLKFLGINSKPVMYLNDNVYRLLCQGEN